MSLILYFISLALFCIGGRNRRASFILSHANYTRFLQGPSLVLAGILGGSTIKRLIPLYGNRKIKNLSLCHRASIISSFVIFAFFPALCGCIRDISRVEVFLSYGVLALGTCLPEWDLWSKGKKRMQAILLDYPSFAMEFALLVNAGLTPQKSWMMASEKNNATEFYLEAGKVSLRCNTGSPFVDSLMVFSAGLAIPEINTFISVITQSVKNGGQDMTHMLKRHALQCWEKRRMEVRKRAEEAGAKLVFPLMLGLVGIIAILAFPAVYMIKNF